MQVPPFDLTEQLHQLGEALEDAVLKVLRSGQYIGGATIAQFEQHFAATIGCPHAIGCNSGTDSLVLALRGLGIGPGDEVITSSFSFSPPPRRSVPSAPRRSLSTSRKARICSIWGELRRLSHRPPAP